MLIAVFVLSWVVLNSNRTKTRKLFCFLKGTILLALSNMHEIIHSIFPA